MARRHRDDDDVEVVYVERKKRGCLPGCIAVLAALVVTFVGVPILLLMIGAPAVRRAAEEARVRAERESAKAPAPAEVPSPAPETAAAPAPSPATIRVGEDVVLWLEGGNGVFLSDEESWNAMLDAENARDLEEIALMMAKGKVIRELNGTRAKLLKNGILSVKVRIRDGANPGFEGWIQREEVRPAP